MKKAALFPLKPLSLVLTVAGLGLFVCQAQETEPIVPPDVAEMESLLKKALETLEEAEEASELGDRQLSIEEASGQKAKAKEAIKAAQEQVRALEKMNALVPVLPLAPGGDAKETDVDQEDAGSSDVLGPAPRKAPKKEPADGESAELNITADGAATLAFTEAERLVIFEDNVMVTHPQFRMECDTLRVFLGEAEGEITKAIATGRMVHFSGTDQKGQPVEATCKLAVYQDDILYLRDWPIITRGSGRLIAQEPSTYFLFPLKEGKENPGMRGKHKFEPGKTEGINDEPEN